MSKAKIEQDEIVEPTPEQRRRAQFAVQDILDRTPNGRQIAIGKAYRRRPMIDELFESGVLDDQQFKALAHYRHHADIADRSLIKDSLGKRVISRGGAGDGPTIVTLNAIRTTKDCENAAGSLAPILRAVVVYDMSLSEWARHVAGSVERSYTRVKGSRQVKVFEIRAKPRALAEATQDIRVAATRVQAELDA